MLFSRHGNFADFLDLYFIGALSGYCKRVRAVSSARRAPIREVFSGRIVPNQV